MTAISKNKLFFNLCAFILMSFIALVFGYWFAYNQVSAISPEALSTYPKLFFLITILKCYCAVFALFALSYLVLSHLSQHKITAFFTAATYLPLLFIFICPIGWLTLLILLFQAISLFYICRRNINHLFPRNMLIDISVLVLLCLLHVFLTTRFSPLNWSKAFLVVVGYNTQEIPVVDPISKGYVLAKLFSFTNMDFSQWAGTMNPPITLASPFMQIMEFILNLPSVSVTDFYIMLLAIYFILIVLGSFGFYLFLKYAGKLYTIFAILGGCMYFFSGATLIDQMFKSDGGVFLSAYAVFPYALLMIALAFERKSWQLAMGAGVALAAQFFFMAPHPEATIYSLGFYLVFSLGLFLFSRNLPWKNKFSLILFSLITYFLLTTYKFIPVLSDQISGNMHVFAHTADISAMPLSYFSRYMLITAIFVPFSLLLFYFRRTIPPVYASSVLLSLFLLTFIWLASYVKFTFLLSHILHIGLHLWFPWRIGNYFCASVAMVALFSVNAAIQVILLLIDQKGNLSTTPGLSGHPAISQD